MPVSPRRPKALAGRSTNSATSACDWILTKNTFFCKPVIIKLSYNFSVSNSSIPVTNLRAGTLFAQDSQIYQVVNYEHIKKARGKAVIKVKARNLKRQGIKELSFKSGQFVEEVEGNRKNFEFVYFDKRRVQIVLVEPETKKRVSATSLAIDSARLKFLKPGQKITALVIEEEIVSFELPIAVELKVVETTASEKGDSAGSVTKPATLESGAVVQVPMFVKVGDIVKANTESGEYMERV